MISDQNPNTSAATQPGPLHAYVGVEGAPFQELNAHLHLWAPSALTTGSSSREEIRMTVS